VLQRAMQWRQVRWGLPQRRPHNRWEMLRDRRGVWQELLRDRLCRSTDIAMPAGEKVRSGARDLHIEHVKFERDPTSLLPARRLVLW